MAVTTTYGFNLPTVGGDTSIWGDKLNTNWSLLDDLLDGTATVTGIDVNGGAIDGTPIGATTPSTGDFSTLAIAGSPAATVAALNTRVPNGTIVMWSGSVASIPVPWYLCDGTNGTPDLRDRFVLGAGSTYAVAATGGAATHTLTAAELAAHTHSVNPPSTSTTSDSHSHSVDPPITNTSSDTHSHVLSADKTTNTSTGGAATRVFDLTDGTTGADTATTTSDTHNHTVNIASFTSGSDSHSHTVDIVEFTSGSTGSGTAHNNMPPYYALAYIMLDDTI